MRALGRGFGRTAQHTPPPVELPACVSCEAAGWPTEVIRRDGIDLEICAEATPCRQRAEAIGVWKAP